MWFLSLETLENCLSLTASEEVATFEVANLQNPLPTTVWRSTSLTPFITGNFGDGASVPAQISVRVDTWGAWYTNARTGDQARLRLANTEAALTAAPLYDSTLVDVWPGSPAAAYITNFLDNWFYTHQRATLTAQPASWFRIDFDYTGNADGYVQCGSLPIGERLTITATNPYRQGFDRTTSRRGGFESSLAGGGLARGGFTGKRNWQGNVLVTENEWLDDIQPLIDSRLNGPVSVVLEESESDRPLDYMYFGYLRDAVPITGRASVEIGVSIVEP
jgi:hypothetical protein